MQMPDDDEAKFREKVAAEVMNAFGPGFERAAEQLAERVQEAARAFHAAIPAKNLTSAEDYQRHLDGVYRVGIQSIMATVSASLGLVKAAPERQSAFARAVRDPVFWLGVVTIAVLSSWIYRH
jgi:hypothetical protein